MNTEAMKLALNDLIAEYHMENSSFAKRVDDIFKEVPAQPQQEPVAWMHEWEDGEKIPMLKGRDDRNQDKPKTVRPLVYGDTSPQPAQPQQEPVANVPGLAADESAFIRWALKNKYDTSSHPMFFVMLDPKTYEARMGWKAAVAHYVLAAAPQPAQQPAPVQQEPVEWQHRKPIMDSEGNTRGYSDWLLGKGLEWWPHRALYTSPPARKPLTDEEIETVWRSVQANDFHDCVKPFARAIEAKHNIKGEA